MNLQNGTIIERIYSVVLALPMWAQNHRLIYCDFEANTLAKRHVDLATVHHVTNQHTMELWH